MGPFPPAGARHRQRPRWCAALFLRFNLRLLQLLSAAMNPSDRLLQSSAQPAALQLDPAKVLILCVDVQERLAPAMAADAMARLTKNATALLRGAQLLNVPVLVTEQYRKGLGATVPELRAVLPEGSQCLEKLEFSAWACAPIAQALLTHQAAGRSQLLVFGMETHICVYQTVRDLCHVGFAVHVPQDAVCSRDPENRRVGLALAERAGAVITATETVLFDLLRRAGTPEFKAVSALIR